MVINMPADLIFKEPETCDYIFVDENNKVHLMLPLVGGDGVAIDNTCKTVMELRSFFHGVPSALDRLNEYRKSLEKDIDYINKVQKMKSGLAHQDTLKEKTERLEQIKEYIELIQELKLKYDDKKEIGNLPYQSFPSYPAAIQELLKSAQNAFAVRLAPHTTDPYTRFNNPLFNLKRNRSQYELGGFLPIREGLSYRLRKTLFPNRDTPTLINKSDKTTVIDAILKQLNAADLTGNEKLSNDPVKREEQFNELKRKIEEELHKIDPNISLDTAADGKVFNLAYLDSLFILDEDSSVKEYIETIFDCTLDATFWEQQTTSVFYDGTTSIDNSEKADNISTKVQFLLAEINVYCKTNKLSEADFGPFFDSEPYATELATLVKEGLTTGADIEPIIHNYVNAHQVQLGLSTQLTEDQQKVITERFNQHYNVIKESPHFDEFFLVDPDQKGNVYVHQGRISCHFLDFFNLQSNGKRPLNVLAGHSDALQQGASNRLTHKNSGVMKAIEEMKQFKEKIVELLANNPKELVNYLVATSDSGVPNYSLLTNETQNYIAFNHNWPELAKEMMANEQIPQDQKEEISHLLSRENVNNENRVAITWEKYSSTSLLEVELNKVAEGLYNTVQKYEENRSESWWKGSRNSARKAQCLDLINVSIEVSDLFNGQGMVSQEQILEKLLKSVDTLDRIDKEISKEKNLFQSSLQTEVRAFRNQLKELCHTQNLAFKSNNAAQTISTEMSKQLDKINNKEVKEIASKLPAHCHTNGAIDLFNTLSPQEAVKVASYLRLQYRELNGSDDKDSLLSDMVSKGSITAETSEQLQQLAQTMRPDMFTEPNILKWSENIELLEDSKLSEILAEVTEISYLIESNKGHLSESQANHVNQFAQKLHHKKMQHPEEIAKLPAKAKETLQIFEIQLKEVLKLPHVSSNSYREQMHTLRDGPNEETDSLRVR